MCVFAFDHHSSHSAFMFLAKCSAFDERLIIGAECWVEKECGLV